MSARILLLLLFAGTLYADVKVRDGRVSADLQSQPLTQVLERLRTQTNIRMVLDEGIAGKTVSASFHDLSVGLALKKILEGTGINYAVLAGADGQPQSIFIGGSSRPGSPPRRLDNRPTGNRGVVSPVAPPPPPVAQPDARQPEPQGKTQTPGVNVPTGGGFVPGQPKSEEHQEREQQPQELLDDNNSED